MAKAMHKQALFGEPGVFDGTKGVDIGINDAALVLAQVGGARIQVDEHGSLVMRLPLERVEQRARSGFGGLAIIEEVVVRQLTVAIAYADWLFERIDPTQRLTHMAISASIEAKRLPGVEDSGRGRREPWLGANEDGT
ncbi:MAG: hypothetical protein IPQ15_15575 [Betaproteobacteria bacterium]|nr:hypothetical protein [Betaproteobacteria bacterium]